MIVEEVLEITRNDKRVIEVWDAADRSESLYQRIIDVLRDNNITREELIDIKYSTVYIPEDKKITSHALIIFDKKEVVSTELDVEHELLRD